MNKNYKISIITVTKNSGNFLEECILSLDKQSYRNYEHIIIDGCSTDNTIDLIKKYNNKITYWVSEKDEGLYDAMNKGIKKCSGDIIGILNSDDIYYPQALKIVNEYFNFNKELDFLFGSVNKYKLMHGYKPKKIKWSFGFYTSHSVGFFIKKKSQLKVGLYNLKYKYSSDYDLFYRMIVHFKLKGMATKKEEILGKFRSGGISSRLSYLDYLKENTKIRIDNGQNIIFVYLIFLARFLRNFRKVVNFLFR
ncbi:glycosyltransferase [Pelagibacteraceae bacterium]|nr:glycosyltransferase [Candidatus Pelagibacter sp.]MDC1485741.1 glycosyltransferase [Pelagibacteraceae bacterium]